MTEEETTARIVAQAATATAKAVSDAAIAAAALIAKEHGVVATQVAVVQSEMGNMDKRMSCLEEALEKIFNRLNDIALGRPTWAVTVILGGLSSLCVGLVVFILSK